MRRGTNLIMLAAIALIWLGGAPRVNAQVIGQPYRLSDKEVEQIIHRVENRSAAFRKSLDDALDRSRLDGTKREDDINAFIKEFNDQTKRLHDRFDDHKSVAADVEAVLNRAAAIETFLRRQRLNNKAETDWLSLRASLDELAQAYNVIWRWEGYPPVPTVSGLPYRLNDKDLEQLLHRVEDHSERFRRSLDAALDKSRLDGTKREDDINAFIKEFDEAVKRLHDRFDEHKSVTADVEAVLDRAARIDDFMRRWRPGNTAEGDWLALRTNLDHLAEAYSVTWRWLG